MADQAEARPKPTVTQFVIYRAESEASTSTGHTAYSEATLAGNSSQFSKRKDYIETSTGRKDVFFIFLFCLFFIMFLGLTGYGCFLAYKPLVSVGFHSYGVAETGLIFLPSIMAQIFATILVSGVLLLTSVAILSWKPKIIYQILIIGAPIIYLILGIGLFWKWQAQAAPIILLALFLIHALYLITRRRAIKMYRFLMISSVKLGTAREKYASPLLIWLIGMCFTAYAIAGAFGFFKTYLDHYEKDDSALYAFYFSFVLFVWVWFLNLMRNQYKMVTAGFGLNMLLREGDVRQDPEHLRPKLWRYVCTRFFGQALHSSFLLTLSEMFVLLVLFMSFEDIRKLKCYFWLVIVAQHSLGLLIRQSGLIHNVMFGSSFFDGTFDVYIPFIFTDELISHVMSLLLLIVCIGAGYAIAPAAAQFLPGKRAETTADLISLVSIYIAMISGEVFMEHVKTTAQTHLVSYGENPLVLARTSPNFTTAVRAVQVADEDRLPEVDE